MAQGSRSQVDFVRAARENDAFRRVLLTGEHEQVVVMTIPPGGDIGEEVHDDTDQVLAFIDGEGEAQLDGETSTFGANDLVFVRAGTRHNFLRVSDESNGPVGSDADRPVHVGRKTIRRETIR